MKRRKLTKGVVFPLSSILSRSNTGGGRGGGGVVLFVIFGQGCSAGNLRPSTPYQTMFRLHIKQPHRYPRLTVPDQVSIPIRD